MQFSLIRNISKICCALIFLWMPLVLVAAPLEEPSIRIRYLGPGSIEGEDKRNDYFIDLLQRALARNGKNYNFEMGPRGLSGLRQLYAISDGTVDVGWSLTSESIEKSLTPVRIPIDKGLIGWRLFLINKEDQAAFHSIKNVTDLQKLLAGQGGDWPDTEVLRFNQYRVEGVSTYGGIFKMLKQKRIQYFPRSILEIWAELDEQKELGLAIEDSIVIHYPAAFYFFVKKENATLAKNIEQGLEKMIKDGEFDRLFNQYYSQVISKARLDRRRVFELENPYLPFKTPLKRSALWVNFEDALQKK